MKSVTRVKDDEALFDMLLHGRVDVIVYEALQGRVWIRNRGLSGIRQLGPPLAVTEMFLYLNVRHRDLAPRVAAALKAMKTDGTWRRIVDSVVGGL
jgi:polar amino acid transport system substrate-binding protein